MRGLSVSNRRKTSAHRRREIFRERSPMAIVAGPERIDGSFSVLVPSLLLKLQ
jgi:hypothetical protein